MSTRYVEITEHAIISEIAAARGIAPGCLLHLHPDPTLSGIVVLYLRSSNRIAVMRADELAVPESTYLGTAKYVQWMFPPTSPQAP